MIIIKNLWWKDEKALTESLIFFAFKNNLIN